MNEEDEKEILTYNDIDILESIGSDICESIRDLIYFINYNFFSGADDGMTGVSSLISFLNSS